VCPRHAKPDCRYKSHMKSTWGVCLGVYNPNSGYKWTVGALAEITLMCERGSTAPPPARTPDDPPPPDGGGSTPTPPDPGSDGGTGGGEPVKRPGTPTVPSDRPPGRYD
jgi:hypothetical protein